MTDGNFSTATKAAGPESQPAQVKTDSTGITHEEVPFLDYHREHGKPFIADHFQLGDTWSDNTGGFPEEVGLIDTYLEDQINQGEIPNDVNAVKEVIKKIEKITNINKNERPVVKIDIIAAYVKFLMTTDKVRFNLKKYG